MDAPDLTDAITYVVADQPSAVDRWHVLPDMTVIYERRPGEFEESRVLTASTLRDRPLWVEISAAQVDRPRSEVQQRSTATAPDLSDQQ